MPSYDFVPLATESYGRLGKMALAFPSELGSTAASRNGRVPKSAFVSALTHLSCALCKGIERMYHASMFTLARAARRQFMPGCAVPVADSLGRCRTLGGLGSLGYTLLGGGLLLLSATDGDAGCYPRAWCLIGVHGASACWRHILIKTHSPLCGCPSHVFVTKPCPARMCGTRMGAKLPR
jgi:hypothetical protein